MINTLLQWHRTDDVLPHDEILVVTAFPDGDVTSCFLMDGQWWSPDAFPTGGPPQWWAHFPVGPRDPEAAALAEPEPVTLKWSSAPRKTEWGFGMVCADVEIDRDHTLTLYCEEDQTAKVDAMLSLARQLRRTEGGEMKDIQAFPFDELNQQTGCVAVQHAGMTLRDYFAASVMGHLCVSPLRQDMTMDKDASYAYRLADAMLKAREAK